MDPDNAGMVSLLNLIGPGLVEECYEGVSAGFGACMVNLLSATHTSTRLSIGYQLHRLKPQL
jgi:hypothetical protein